jgi:hypothetical protein
MTALARIVSMERQTVPPSDRAFEAWFECSICRARVHLGDRFCRFCGVKFA